MEPNQSEPQVNPQGYVPPAPAVPGKPDSDVFKIGAIFIVLVLVIAGAIYWYVTTSQSAPAVPTTSDNLENAAADVLLSETNTDNLNNELNPVDTANPFSDLQVNPFE